MSIRRILADAPPVASVAVEPIAENRHVLRATVEQLALFCRPHNQHQARADFGDAAVQRAIAARQARPR